LREGDGVAAKVLKNLDVDIEQCRQEILKELDPNFAGRRIFHSAEGAPGEQLKKLQPDRRKGRSQNARTQGVRPRPHGNREEGRHGPSHRPQK